MLGKYYTEMREELTRPNDPVHKLDNKGIIINKIPYTSIWDYFPVAIAGYGLANFQRYLDKNDEKYKETFLKQADWLVNNITIKNDNIGVWEHKFTLPYYDFKIPWIHGMAQGWGISALLRAYQVTDKDVYLEIAKNAYRSFEIDISYGGVRFFDEDHNIWLEEYALIPPPHVLNGFIFASFGVYDFYLFTKSKNTLDLWKKCIKTLAENLHCYDIGYWSVYDLMYNAPSTFSYHNLHIEQLEALYKITKEKKFIKFSERWREYLKKRINKGRVTIKREIIHIKRYGVRECTRRYLQQRKWQKGE